MSKKIHDSHHHHKCKCCKSIVKNNCCKCTIINYLPYVISKPGKYAIRENLTYDGSNKAITVHANGVTIVFCGSHIELTNLSATGIYGNDVSKLTIKDGHIFTPTIAADNGSKGIDLVECKKVKLDSLLIRNTTYGTHIQNCEDVFVTHSHYVNHINAIGLYAPAIRVEGSKAVVVEESVFQGANTLPEYGSSNCAVDFTKCQTCRISNCQFPDSDTSVSVVETNGCTIENCIFERAINTSGIQMLLYEAQGTVIRSCIFTQVKGPIAFCNCILPITGKDLLIENCVFNDATIPSFPCTCIGTIGVSKGDLGSDVTLPFENVIIRGNEIACSSLFCMEIGGGANNILVENNTFKGGEQPLEFQIPGIDPALLNIDSGASNITIKNNSFHKGTYRGVWLSDSLYSEDQGTSKNIVFENNVISGCGEHGLVVEGNHDNVVIKDNKVIGNTNDGIHLNMDANAVHLHENLVRANLGTGINNLSATATTLFNVSCNNGINCVGVTPVQSPGDSPIVVGSNICCPDVEAMNQLNTNVKGNLIKRKQLNKQNNTQTLKQILAHRKLRIH